MFFHPTPLFKSYLRAQRQVQADYEQRASCNSPEGAPCKCPKCNSCALEDVEKSRMDSYLMEYEVVCKECLEHVAYWAHGYFLPYVPPEYSEFFTLP